MNHSTKSVYFLSVGIGLVLAVLVSVFRSILLLTGYSPTLGHFYEGPAADIFLPLFFVLSIVVAVGFGIFFRSFLSNRALKQTLPSIFASGLAALTMLVWLITLLTNAVRYGTPSGPLRPLLTLLSFFTLLCIGHFVYSAVGGTNVRLQALLCASLAVFCAFYMLYAYFDTTFTLNSPIKIFDQITFFILALFFLAECRFHVNKVSDAVFLPIGMIAMVFTAANAAPGLIYAASEGTPLVGSVMHDFLSLALFLYVVARMLSFPLSVSEQGKQDVFAAEMAEDSTPVYEDEEDQIAEGDPRQETFHFDEDEGDAADSTLSPTRQEEPSDNEEEPSVAQTTLTFDRKSNV